MGIGTGRVNTVVRSARSFILLNGTGLPVLPAPSGDAYLQLGRAKGEHRDRRSEFPFTSTFHLKPWFIEPLNLNKSLDQLIAPTLIL